MEQELDEEQVLEEKEQKQGAKSQGGRREAEG